MSVCLFRSHTNICFGDLIPVECIPPSIYLSFPASRMATTLWKGKKRFRMLSLLINCSEILPNLLYFNICFEALIPFGSIPASLYLSLPASCIYKLVCISASLYNILPASRKGQKRSRMLKSHSDIRSLLINFDQFFPFCYIL